MRLCGQYVLLMQTIRNSDYKYREEVCFVPGQYPLYAADMGIVVVIDILAATSAMVAAFHHGGYTILRVPHRRGAVDIGREGYIAAAEREARWWRVSPATPRWRTWTRTCAARPS